MINNEEKRRISRGKLLRLRWIDYDIKAIRNNISKLNIRMGPSGISGSTIGKERVSGGGAEPTLEQLKRLTELQSTLRDAQDKAVVELLEILLVLNNISDDGQRAILRNKYINFFTLEQISSDWGISIESTKRLHRRALESYYEAMTSSKC